MRILVINPNTSVSVTEKIAAVALNAAAPGTALEFVTASYGVPYIATRAEAIIGGRVVLEILAEREADFDAAVIAAFGDPGLGGARELMSIPIIGLAEAAMLMACPLGRKFSIVSFSSRLEPWYRECVEWNDMSSRLASIRMLDVPVNDIGRVQADNENLLVELACETVDQDGAEVIILAGAPLAGLATHVRERVPVPVVESVTASIKLAESLVTLQTRKARVGSYRQSAPKAATGLTPALQQVIERGCSPRNLK